MQAEQDTYLVFYSLQNGHEGGVLDFLLMLQFYSFGHLGPHAISPYNFRAQGGNNCQKFMYITIGHSGLRALSRI